MRSVGLVLLLVFLVCFMVAAAVPAAAQGDNGVARRIVVFNPGCDSVADRAAVVEAAGGVATRHLRLVRGMAALLTPAAERELRGRPEVLRVDVDGVVHATVNTLKAHGNKHTPPPPPVQFLPWGVDRIDAEWAWSVSRGAGVKVAVIDTGIDWSHPDLVDNLGGGVNYTSRNWWSAPNLSAWNDDNGHGSHVAGIIAGVDNTIGVIGVAPEATLYAVKVLNKQGSGYDSDVIAGIEWAVDNGMDIANMSLGSNGDDPSLHAACDAAAAGGLILVAAAGNDGNAVDYPGAYSSVIAVAALDINDQVASWSSHGPQVRLAAPGVSITSCWKGSGYATISGTSMASPHVAGAIALNLSANPFTTADNLLGPGWDEYTGYGIVDAGEIGTGIVNYGNDLP